MVDLNKDEVKRMYFFLKKFLRNFELDPLEKKFWNEVHDLEELIMIKDKLKRSLENA